MERRMIRNARLSLLGERLQQHLGELRSLSDRAAAGGAVREVPQHRAVLYDGLNGWPPAQKEFEHRCPSSVPPSSALLARCTSRSSSQGCCGCWPRTRWRFARRRESHARFGWSTVGQDLLVNLFLLFLLLLGFTIAELDRNAAGKCAPCECAAEARDRRARSGREER